MRKSIFCALVPFMCLSACATITRGSSQSFVIESEPSNADVALSTGQICKTPCSLKLKRKKGFTAKISKKGYQTIETSVTSQMAGAGGAALAGNIFLGGIIGAGVDAGTGATRELLPNPLRVKLEPETEQGEENISKADKSESEKSPSS